ncbi:MAG: lactoylglutathione lyase [Clostridiaceae bacterium]|nr:lactoylglutathione lyase [Clostridiaceae bacterium]
MMFKLVHTNFNVLDLDKSMEFYQQALDMKVSRIKEASDGSFKLAFMTDEIGQYELELTWLADRKEPYDLGDNEIHLAVRTEDYEGAHKRHQEMGCICYENKSMGLYFINDPDGYWIEIIPVR